MILEIKMKTTGEIMIPKKNIAGAALVLIVLAVGSAFAADTCDLGKTVGTKAAASFKTDKAAGIRLYTKALELCPDSAAISYNLGTAYYIYGRPDMAVTYLTKAVKLNDGKAQWLNNLAAVLLETNGSTRDAVQYSGKAADLNRESAEIQDTYARAVLADGDIWQALNIIKDAHNKWSGDKHITKNYDAILDRYLSYYLQKIKDGDVDAGLAGLKKADFSSKAVKIYLLALDKSGRSSEALKEAAAARTKFPGDSDLAGVFDKLVGQTTRKFYLDFQAGKTNTAVSAAKKFAAQYPGNKTAQKAYDELLNALLADTANIEVPAAVTSGSKDVLTDANRSASLLAGLSGGSSGADGKIDLKVDVDENIPSGHLKRKYGIAVVIGNQRYAAENRGIVNVQYAERDAAVMKQYLVKVMGYNPANIIYETNITSGDFRNIFGSKENPKGKLYNFIRPGESEVFIYYVGHGAPGPDGNSAYLVPVDAEADFIANNGYSLDLFYKILAKLPAKEITVVLDACFSGDSYAGPLFSKISPAMLKNVKPVREVANSTIFAGADQGQVCAWYPAKRHSLFTYFFLKGLSGAADGNGDKSITTGEMGNYLGKEVPYWARREVNRAQNPLVMGTGDMVLAKF